ncbi:hypothetical protein A0257_04200 [Hymenobacter psoromatis]|nr:hypothetical protein A0257_04200 [Hymenobacter psoromatis]
MTFSTFIGIYSPFCKHLCFTTARNSPYFLANICAAFNKLLLALRIFDRFSHIHSMVWRTKKTQETLVQSYVKMVGWLIKARFFQNFIQSVFV